jgi:nitrile hydratase
MIAAMDGIHDLGGMHGFGPVEIEPHEPLFHAPWEGRVFALSGVAIAAAGHNVDKFRHAIERIDPVTYLTAGYYGRWLRAIETLLSDAGEIGRPAGQVGRRSVRRDAPRAPRFRAGDPVRARNLHPPGHTRLPRYARGKRGRIEAVYDAYVFPDTNAHDRGEDPQHVYCVAFAGEELWGADAEPGTVVHLDLFEPYLETHHE